MKVRRGQPLNDSATCDYKNGGKNYEGLPVYCLEKDPVNDLCLKWYPITYVTGSHYSASMIDDKINGYSDRLPLYYCLQSDNLLGRQTIVVVNSHDETIIEAGNARKNLIFSSRPFWISAKWAPGDNDYVATHFAGQRTEANAAYEATHCNDDGQHAGCNTNWNYLAFDMNQNNQFDDSDRMANQLWAVAQNSDAELNIADIDKITFRLDWKSDNNWPTAVGTILTTITSDQLYADKNSPNYPQMFRIAGDEGLFSGMWIGIKFLWNNQGQLVGYRASGLANRQNDAIAFSPIFYLKNRCTVIAQVVDSTGDNKVYLNRFNSGDWLSNQGNRAGVNKELTDASQYFGATTVQVAAPFGSFMAPENSLPDQWQNRSSLPLVNYYGGRYDYNKFAGFPLSVARIDNDNARRRCFGGTKDGDFCNTNTNCLGGGVCMGIGKFCYVDRPNGGDLTNGQACESTADCTAPFDDGCALLSSLPTGENGIGQAIANLQGLFAKIYGVWRWTGNSYQSFNPGVALDAAAANGTLPVLEKITISPNQIQAHGGLAKLSFGTVVDVNQVPIRSLTINWGDTQSDTLTWLNSRSDFSLNHSYTCLMSPNGHSCSGCPGGTLIENRQCRYNITVSVVDNWELPNQNQAAGSVLVGY
ncbi:MAG: hypothetical protein NTV81_03020 [Candidatus Komeilibacteria bacterium]|nr:hypothetical protein [Candidatus Komeilibacteria bacterium]